MALTKCRRTIVLRHLYLLLQYLEKTADFWFSPNVSTSEVPHSSAISGAVCLKSSFFDGSTSDNPPNICAMTTDWTSAVPSSLSIRRSQRLRPALLDASDIKIDFNVLLSFYLLPDFIATFVSVFGTNTFSACLSPTKEVLVPAPPPSTTSDDTDPQTDLVQSNLLEVRSSRQKLVPLSPGSRPVSSQISHDISSRSAPMSSASMLPQSDFSVRERGGSHLRTFDLAAGGDGAGVRAGHRGLTTPGISIGSSSTQITLYGDRRPRSPPLLHNDSAVPPSPRAWDQSRSATASAHHNIPRLKVTPGQLDYTPMATINISSATTDSAAAVTKEPIIETNSHTPITRKIQLTSTPEQSEGYSESHRSLSRGTKPVLSLASGSGDLEAASAAKRLKLSCSPPQSLSAVDEGLVNFCLNLSKLEETPTGSDGGSGIVLRSRTTCPLRSNQAHSQVPGLSLDAIHSVRSTEQSRQASGIKLEPMRWQAPRAAGSSISRSLGRRLVSVRDHAKCLSDPVVRLSAAPGVFLRSAVRETQSPISRIKSDIDANVLSSHTSSLGSRSSWQTRLRNRTPTALGF
ncbi:unnamed protein product [Protopolystoma xenopodis]|uniref:Uncharacterized protein n=1 Tax=Protopolystoma xenopodis TaxID=117903 RepID=A0A448WHY9_9PLAT|nr:unnamed protein product [Protopolystoma xenopodis]